MIDSNQPAPRQFASAPTSPEPASASLSRSYKMLEVAWTDTDAQGATLATIHLPDDLCNETYISKRMAEHAYFKYKAVRLTVRVNTNKYQYGSLMVSYRPFYNNAVAHRVEGIYARSQCNAVVITASTGASTTIDVPLVMPKALLPIHAIGSTHFSYGGTVWIDVLNPLDQIGDVETSCTVSVFGEFIEPKLYGLSPGNELPEAVAHSKGESIAKTERRGFVSEAMEKVAPLLEMVPAYGPPAAAAVRALIPFAKTAGLNKPATLSSPQYITEDQHPHFAQGAGVDVATRLTIRPEAEVSVDPAIVGDEKRLSSLVEICKHPTLVKVAYFDSEALPDVVQFYFHCSPFGATLVQYDSTFCFVPPYAGWYANMFRYFRGSLRYVFHFVTSPFIKARVRISYDPRGTNQGSGFMTGDAFSKIVDISGDTIVDFIVPWLSEEHYLRSPVTNSDLFAADVFSKTSIGTLAVSLVDYISSPDTTDVVGVYCNIWESACDDFQCIGFSTPMIHRIPVYTETPTAIAQFDSRAHFKTTSQPLMDAAPVLEFGICSGDNEMDLYSLLKRYTDVPTSLIDTSQSTVIVTPEVNYGEWSATSYLCYPFMFYRGSMRVLDLNSGPTVRNAMLFYSFGSGDVTWEDGTNGDDIVLPGRSLGTYEIPWKSSLAFREVVPVNLDHQDTNFAMLYTLTPSPLVDWFRQSVGDDFSLGWLSNTGVLFTTTAVPAPSATKKPKTTASKTDLRQAVNQPLVTESTGTPVA